MINHDSLRDFRASCILRAAILLAVGVVPLSANAVVTATPPPGGYTQPASSLQNGSSTFTNFSETGSGSSVTGFGGTSTCANGTSSGAPSGTGAEVGGGGAGLVGSLMGSASENGQTPIGSGGLVQGTCNSVGGDVANLQNLITFQNNLIATINQVGATLNTGQMQQLQATEQQTNQMLQEQSQNAKDMATETAKQRYLQETTGINALPDACELASGAADTLSGIASAQQVAAGAVSAAIQSEQPVVNPLTSVDALANATAPAFSAGTVLPLGTTPSAATASQIGAYIKNSVVPFNAPSVPAGVTNPAATNFKAVSNIMSTQASLATVTLAAIARHNAPVVSAHLANYLWTQAGNTGTPPGEIGGKISQDGLLQSITNGRYANPAFYNGLQVTSSGDTVQVKKIDIMMAAQLRMEEEEETMLEHAVALQAAMLASEESGRVSQLNEDRGNAMAQTNGAMSGAQ